MSERASTGGAIGRETAEILLARIDERLGEMGKTRYWLANQATEGKNKGLITDLARKGYLPKEPRLHRIAQLLGVSVDWLMGRSELRDPVASEVGVADRRLDFAGFPRSEPGIPILGTGDCADMELCDEGGHLVSVERSSFDPDFTVRMLKRPPALSGAKDLYAIEFHGDSMAPRFEPMEIGIVDPRRPVARGDYVLVQLRPAASGEGDREYIDEVESVLVKRLVRQTAKEYVLEQFNPPVTFTLPKARVKRIHKIMRQTDYLF